MRQSEDVDLIRGVVLAALAPFSSKDILQNLDAPLFEGGLELDSISFLDLILEIEGKLGLSRDSLLTTARRKNSV